VIKGLEKEKDKKGYVMRKRIITTIMTITVLLTLFSTSIGVYAADYSEKSSGYVSISAGNKTNTLYYRNPHGNFKLEIWVDAGNLNAAHAATISKKYSIRMYDNAGRCVWSASGQTKRTYEIGGNVTKIVITTDATVGPVLHWIKK